MIDGLRDWPSIVQMSSHQAGSLTSTTRSLRPGGSCRRGDATGPAYPLGTGHVLARARSSSDIWTGKQLRGLQTALRLCRREGVWAQRGEQPEWAGGGAAQGEHGNDLKIHDEGQSCSGRQHGGGVGAGRKSPGFGVRKTWALILA